MARISPAHSPHPAHPAYGTDQLLQMLQKREKIALPLSRIPRGAIPPIAEWLRKYP